MAYKLNDHGYRVSQYLKEKDKIIVLIGSISLSSVIVLCCPKVFHYGEEMKYFVSSLELNNEAIFHAWEGSTGSRPKGSKTVGIVSALTPKFLMPKAR